jgi:hypothetical protein
VTVRWRCRRPSNRTRAQAERGVGQLLPEGYSASDRSARIASAVKSTQIAEWAGIRGGDDGERGLELLERPACRASKAIRPAT